MTKIIDVDFQKNKKDKLESQKDMADLCSTVWRQHKLDKVW